MVLDVSHRPSTAVAVSIVFLAACGQFLDAFNSSAYLLAIPSIADDLKLHGNLSVWIISAFQVPFSAFLLLSGRVSDVYSPKLIFVGGIGAFGALSLVSGFLDDKVAFLVLRGLIGIAAALTIPSALHIIMHVSPTEVFRVRAIAAFGGSIAIANISGLILGAVLVQFSSWRWILFFEAMVALPIALASTLLVPRDMSVPADGGEERRQRKYLDWWGIGLLTTALLLFVLGITSGASSGWRSPIVIAPVALSVVLLAAFVAWQKHLPHDRSSLPREVWGYSNVIVLCVVAIQPMLWWTQVFFSFSTLWQQLYYDPITTAAHLLPVGVLAVLVMALSPSLAKTARQRKYVILTGQALVVAGTVLLPFADRPARYWPFAFPAFCLGTSGIALVFTHANIAIMGAAPPALSGTVGAIFNTALQVGGAVGVAALTALQANIDEKHVASRWHFEGRAAAFWMLLGLVIVCSVVFAVLFDPDGVAYADTEMQAADDTARGDSIGIDLPVLIGSSELDVTWEDIKKVA